VAHLAASAEDRAVTTTVAPPPGPHGDDVSRLARRLGIDVAGVLDLSVSLNPCAADVAALVRDAAGSVRHYPDATHATHALARAMHVAPERVVLTNGGAEAIALVAGWQPEGWVDEPDFALYARHLDVVTPGAPRWRSNPHNPTGRLAAAEETAAVWDESFYALATGDWTRGDAGAVVVGSLTKLFACPGLRIGYVVMPDAVSADAIRARQPRWSVSAIACAVLPGLLEHLDLPATAAAVATLRGALVDVLRAAGLEPEPSDACFVLVPHADGLREHLARRAVLVRDTGSFGLPGGARIAVPDDDGRARLASALQEWSR
jgi:histidinol-phosphate/aromatic aminotransferase/cobyric acid decarboxylase-like protein